MEIKNELKKQNVIDVKRITIKKQNEIIETNTYILTFNNPKPPLEIKIGYTVVKVETYIPNPRNMDTWSSTAQENKCVLNVESRNQTT